MFDVTFLTSNWTCIFGNGCQGVLTGPAPELVQGCCSYGAHLVNKKDARRVEKAAATLTPEEWQNHGTKKAVIHENKGGETVTRLVDDACIFLNKPDFPGGVGCAFHIAAMNRGVDHMTLEARGLLAAAAAPGRRGRRRRGARHLGHPAVGPPPLGQGRPRVPLVVHRVTRGLRRDQARLPRDAARAHEDGGREGLRPLRRTGGRARSPADEGCGRPASSSAEPWRRWHPHGLARLVVQRGQRQSFSGSSSATALVGIDPRMRSYWSSSARHQDAWTSSGSAPHSAHRPVDSVDDRFRLRASSKRRWRPFFTRTPCHTRTAYWRPPPYGRTVRATSTAGPL